MKHFLPFLLCLAVFFFSQGVEAAPRRARRTRPLGMKEKLTYQEKQQIINEIEANGSKAPTEYNLSVQIDHYNNEPVTAVSNSFNVRYLINDQYFNKSQGPILFYTGNEADIWEFYRMSGFITDTLAKKLGALVVFCEHRYYGTSYPFGTEAEAKKTENLKFLTVPQVLWDFIDVIDLIRRESYYGINEKAVIAVGGSYGGMLSAWMRMKYPNQVQGALASSAPILWFNGTINPNTWDNIAANVVKNKGSLNCWGRMKFGFYDITSLAYDKFKWPTLKEKFNMCNSPTSPDDMNTFIALLQDTIESMVQVNYPYEVGSLPADPVATFCAIVDTITAEAEAKKPEVSAISTFDYVNIDALVAAANVVWNNIDNKTNCVNFDGTIGANSSAGLPDSWDIQTCLDLPMPLGTDPAQACWTWINWDQAGWTANCQFKFDLTPQYDWALDYFGGRWPSADFEHSSNIIFSNGDIDPWSGGGLMQNITTNNIVLVIEGAAHHLDLRAPVEESDPASVKMARLTEYAHIKQWVEDYQEQVVYDLSIDDATAPLPTLIQN